MTIVRWDSSRDMAALQQQENLSRLQQETLSRMLEGYYRRPQEDLNRGAWVPVVDIYSNGARPGAEGGAARHEGGGDRADD